MITLNIITGMLDFLLHLDDYMMDWVREYRNLTYLFLFLIVFVETGLVVMPFLPGDSLLFAAGSIAALDNTLNVFIIIPLLILGTMTYQKFIGYCIAGAVLWVTSLTTAGYLLGSHPWVKENFELVVFGIIGVSLMPIVVQFLRSRFAR